MPCYTLVTVTVAFKAAVRDRLIAAITDAGYVPVDVGNAVGIQHQRGTFWIDLENQEVNASQADVSAYSDVLNKVKRSYSRLTTEEIAKKKKWTVHRAKGSETKLQLRRR